jgi:sorbitol-specific phosphotransferase system component IIA
MVCVVLEEASLIHAETDKADDVEPGNRLSPARAVALSHRPEVLVRN